MRIEILAIGDELLDGRVVDTNTIRLAQALGEVGLQLRHRSTVTDDISDITREAHAAMARGTQLCVVSGGLGPTADDLTAEAFARLCGVTLLRDAAVVEKLQAYFKRRNRPLSQTQLRQADRPQNATIVPNSLGTAPGFALMFGGCQFVSLPGVPQEFDAMVQDYIIAPHRKNRPVARRALYCFGLMEADVDQRLARIRHDFPLVRLQFRIKFPEVHVTMHAPEADQAALDDAFAYAREQLGAAVFADHTGSPSFAQSILSLCVAQQATLALAESCTGGLVGDLLTDVSGSSSALHGGVVAYDNAVKTSLLGVSPATLQQHGAVSELVVTQMAQRVRQMMGTTHGLGISGIAGPTGGTPQKPAGTIWLAVAGPQGVTTQQLNLPFGRRANKQVAAYTGLQLLRGVLAAAA